MAKAKKKAKKKAKAKPEPKPEFKTTVIRMNTGRRVEAKIMKPTEILDRGKGLR